MTSKSIMPIVNPVNAPLSPNTGVPGWLHDNEETLLIDHVRVVPNDGLILQIGHECGRSTSLLSQFSKPTVTIHSIDIDPRASQWTQHNLKAVSLWRDNITLHVADSAKIDFDKCVDLLFIDGLHTYAGALSDLLRFGKLVKSGGYMLLHDVACKTNLNPHPLHQEVYQALIDYMVTESPYWLSWGSTETIVVYSRK